MTNTATTAPGVTLWPRTPIEGQAPPVTYPQATAWKGSFGDGVTIYQGADIIATWDAGTWDHIETADARAERATPKTPE